MRLKIWWVVVVLVLSGLQVTAQQEGVPVQANIAVEIAIDQSGNLFNQVEAGSSSGDGAPTRAEGGADLARGIGLHTVQWLASFQAQQASVGRSTRIDVSMGAFGSEYESVVPWTRLDAPTFEAAQTQYRQIETDVTAKLTNSLGQTDYIDAFAGIKRSFEALASKTDVADSQRVVLLITDGVPCANHRSEWSSADGACQPNRTGAGANHLLSPSILDTLRDFEADNVRVILLPITSVTYSGYDKLAGAWNGLISDDLVEQPVSIPNEAAIGVTMNALMFNLLPEGYEIGVSVGGGRVAVDPYLAQMTVTLYKAVASEHLSLTTPGGQTLTAGQGVRVVGESMLAEVWTIDTPAPGAWVMTGGTGAIYMDSRPVEARFEIPQDRFAFQKIDMALVLGGEGDLPSYPPNFTLKGALIIQPDGGLAQSVNLIADPSQPGRFIGSYTPTSAASHRVSLDVGVDSGRLPGGLSSLTSSFNTAPVRVEIDGLDNGDRPLRGEPRTFQLHLRDTTGQPVPNIEVRQFALILPPIGETACPPPNVAATTAEGVMVLSAQLTASDSASWKIENYIFPQSGLQRFCPLVQINDLAQSSNSFLTIRDAASAVTLDIEQEQRVLLKLSMNAQTSAEATPNNRVEYTYSNPRIPLFTFFQAPEAEVVVEAVFADENGRDTGDPADIATELVAAGENPQEYLCLIITGSGRSLMKENNLRLAPTNAPNEWRVKLGVLPEGTYDIRLVARDIPTSATTDETTADSATLAAASTTVPLCEEQIFLPDTGRIGNRNLRFDPAPIVLASLVVTTDNTPLYIVGGTVLAIIGAGYFGIVRPLQRRVNSITGKLVIKRGDEDILTVPLDVYGLNDITVEAEKGHLPIVEPPILSMRVTRGDNGKLNLEYALGNPNTKKSTPLTKGEAYKVDYTSWRGGDYTITWVDK